MKFQLQRSTFLTICGVRCIRQLVPKAPEDQLGPTCQIKVSLSYIIGAGILIRGALSEMKHPDTLTSLNNLASVLRAQGKYEETEKLRERDLAGRDEVLGMEHPSTLGSVYNLAYLFHSKRQYDAASGLYQRAIAGYQKALGSHNPPSLACSGDYSSILEELNEKNQAIEVDQRLSVKLQHRKSSCEHEMIEDTLLSGK